MVLGRFGLVSNLHMDVKDGWMGIYVVANPRIKEFNPRQISMSSVSGRIFVGSYLDLWPDPHYDYTFETNIETVNGSIEVKIPHGSSTNISASGKGYVTAFLMPFMRSSASLKSEIYTSLQSGYIFVIVDDSRNRLGYVAPSGYNPLSNTKSTHYVGAGDMTLDYPTKWFGQLEAKIKDGYIKFDGTDLHDVKRDKGYIKAKRGHHGKSDLMAEVGRGFLDVRVGAT